MNQVFDFKRMILFARLKFNLNKKILLLSVLGYFAFVFIVSFFISYNIDSRIISVLNGFHYGALGFMLIAGTIFLAGRSFQDMNTSERSLSQILVPSSTLEKFIVPLIFTSIGWLIFSVLSYELFALLINGLWSIIFGFQFEALNIFEFMSLQYFWDILFTYFFLHSVFFLGSAAFKKYPIAKTILVNFLINWGYAVLMLLLIMILFGGFESFGVSMEALAENIKLKEWLNIENIEQKARVYRSIAFVVLSLLLYVTAFFKLKEREV